MSMLKTVQKFLYVRMYRKFCTRAVYLFILRTALGREDDDVPYNFERRVCCMTNMCLYILMEPSVREQSLSAS